MQNAVLNFQTQNSTGGAFMLAIDTDNAKVGGLTNSDGIDVYVYAGRLHSSTSGNVEDLFKDYSIYKTLEICVADGESYAFSGTFRGNLDVIKSGAGTQELSGNIENNKILVQAGTLILSGEDKVAQEVIVSATGTLEISKNSVSIYDLEVEQGATLKVDSAATLNLSGITKLGETLTTNAGTIVFSETSIIALDHITATSTGTGASEIRTYVVIDNSTGTIEGWMDLTQENFSLENATLTNKYTNFDVSTAGTVTVSGVLGLVWNGTIDNHEWKADDSSYLFWTDSLTNSADYFQTGDNVFFTSTNNAYEPVDVLSDITLSSLVVLDGSFTLNIASGYTISMTDVTVESGARLIFDGSASVKNRAIVDGVLELYGAPQNQISGHGIVVLKDTSGNGMTIGGFDDDGNALAAILDGSIQLSVVGNTGEGAGTVKIASAQNYSGGTLIHEGTLAIGDSLALGHGTVTLNAGTLQIDEDDLDLMNNVVVEGPIQYTDAFGDEHDFAGTPKIDTNGHDFNLSGTLNVAENVTLEKIGAGELRLLGNTNIAGTLDVQAGSLYVDLDSYETFYAENLSVGAGLTAFFDLKTTLPEVAFGTVTLGDGALLQQYSQMSMPLEAVEIGKLELTGTTATISVGDSQGIRSGTENHDDDSDNSFGASWKIDELVGGNADSPATLVLEADHKANNFTTFEFAGTQTAGEFTGTVSLQETHSGTNRNSGIIISNAHILENAVVELATPVSSNAELALAINCDYAKIAGLSSEYASSDVFAGTIAAGGGSGTTLYNLSTTMATLEICVADGEEYSFAGTIFGNIQLTKTGAGTQILAGTSQAAGATFVVESGILELQTAGAIGSDTNVTVGAAGTLLLGVANVNSSQTLAGTGTIAKADSVAGTATFTTEVSSFEGTISAGTKLVIQNQMTGTLAIGENAALEMLKGDQGHISTNAGTIQVGSLDGTTNQGTKLTLDGVSTGTITVARDATLIANTDSVGEVSLANSGATLSISETVETGAVTFAAGASVFVQKNFDGETTSWSDGAKTFVALDVFAESAIAEQSATTVLADLNSYFTAASSYSTYSTAYFDTGTTNGVSYVRLVYEIPEPSFFGLLAGTLALALAGTRRRRKKL